MSTTGNETVISDVAELKLKIREIIFDRDDPELIKKLIDQGQVDVNDMFISGGTMLLSAVCQHRLGTVKMLLEQPQTDVNVLVSDADGACCSTVTVAMALRDRVIVNTDHHTFVRDNNIIEMLMNHPSFDLYFKYPLSGYIWDRPMSLTKEECTILKTMQKKKFKDSKLKDLWDDIMPGEVEIDGEKVDGPKWPPGMVELNLAPFLLPKIPDEVEKHPDMPA